jgi:pseudo-rSAM protein
MDTYWLYLESYTFVFADESSFLFYNSLSGEYFTVTKNIVIDDIVNELLDPNSMYCINIGKSELNNQAIKSLIKNLRNTFTGDFFNKKFVSEKPVILYPKLYLMKSIHSEGVDIGDNILYYLHNLIVQLTDYCDFKCNVCECANKQIITCSRKQEENLPFQIFQELVKNISASPVSEIKIRGGNVFLYPEIDKLCDFIKSNTSAIFKLYIDYKHVLGHEDILAVLSENENVIFIVQARGNISKEDFHTVIYILNDLNIYCLCEFIISNEEQYHIAEEFCGEYKIENFSFIPIVTDKNLVYIKDILSLDEDVIFSRIYSKKDIFRHQTLNTKDFGTITVMANGDVYANVNMSPLGNIKETSLPVLLTKELTEGSSWLRIRNQKPCNNCLYQWLCPSPSNYELVIGKYNLCHVKP